MPEGLIMLGFILLIVGILLIIIGSFSAKDSKVGFGGVIGPFVIGFGNDPQLTKLAIMVSVALAVLFVLLFLKGFL